jgi:hypothetical protein
MRAYSAPSGPECLLEVAEDQGISRRSPENGWSSPLAVRRNVGIVRS